MSQNEVKKEVLVDVVYLLKIVDSSLSVAVSVRTGEEYFETNQDLADGSQQTRVDRGFLFPKTNFFYHLYKHLSFPTCRSFSFNLVEPNEEDGRE